MQTICYYTNVNDQSLILIYFSTLRTINIREYRRALKKDNPEKLATHGTQDEENQNKNTTQYVLDTTIGKQTHTTQQRTCVLLQTTGGKDEPNIVIMQKSQ